MTDIVYWVAVGLRDAISPTFELLNNDSPGERTQAFCSPEAYFIASGEHLKAFCSPNNYLNRQNGFEYWG